MPRPAAAGVGGARGRGARSPSRDSAQRGPAAGRPQRASAQPPHPGARRGAGSPRQVRCGGRPSGAAGSGFLGGAPSAAARGEAGGAGERRRQRRSVRGRRAARAGRRRPAVRPALGAKLRPGGAFVRLRWAVCGRRPAALLCAGTTHRRALLCGRPGAVLSGGRTSWSVPPLPRSWVNAPGFLLSFSFFLLSVPFPYSQNKTTVFLLVVVAFLLLLTSDTNPALGWLRPSSRFPFTACACQTCLSPGLGSAARGCRDGPEVPSGCCHLPCHPCIPALQPGRSPMCGIEV